ncbi:MAG TPA: DUF1015 family protein [Nocardioides sp.]|nr:DUF1015 family protein [Nocardioides sp.]
MTTVRLFPARVVRQESARRTVSAMSDSQDESGVDLFGVSVDPASYDESPAALYVYRQSRGDESYIGVVCDVAVQAVADGRVRGHEAVHQLRVDALVWHHARADAPPALVMLLHRAGPEFARTLAEAQQTEPVLDFDGPQGLQQTVWRLPDGPAAQALAAELAAAELYIADGHHRTAAALEEWRVAGKPPDAGLLCVVHQMDGLSLSAFHRRISGPLDPARLLGLLRAEFEVREAAGPPVLSVGAMGLYVASRWYDVRLPDGRLRGVAGLDVTILQARVLDRLDPAPPGRVRTVDTVPATTPLDELLSHCDVDGGALFTLAPPPPEALTEVADAGEVMPPKTTYFEPKPAAGIFLRR